MINLIKNELFKIFKKKTFYVMLIIVFGLTLLGGYLTKKFNERSIFNFEIGNTSKKGDAQSYAADEIDKLKNKYGKTYKRAIIMDYQKYREGDNLESYFANQFLKKPKNDALYKEFLSDLKLPYKEYFKKAKAKALKIEDKKLRDVMVYRADYYLKHNIENNLRAIVMIENYTLDALSYSMGEIPRASEYSKGLALSKYKLEHEIYKDNELFNLNMGYGIFIVIFIGVIAGSIVSTEYAKGTIKFLLMKPFSRTKIYLSKVIAAFIAFIAFLVAIHFAVYLSNAIFDGFSFTSYVYYSDKLNKVVEINAIKYLLMSNILYLPYYLLLLALAIFISSATISSAAGTAITIGAPILFQLAESMIYQFRYKILTVFPPLHSDFRYLITGAKHPVKVKFDFAYNYTWVSSLIIVSATILGLLVLGALIFKKRDVKNI